MRHDMAKVVTEPPRRGHAAPSTKWGRRLGKHEHDAEDHGSTRAPIARRRQYGYNAKVFSDALPPLRRYLRKQVGRPWNTVWSEITRSFDSRSLSGGHLLDHIRAEVAHHTFLGADGRVFDGGHWGPVPVGGLFVHPRTGLLCYAPEPWRGKRTRPFNKAQAALRAFGIEIDTLTDAGRYRIDDMQVWERRDNGWFIHTYRLVPEQLVRVVTWGDGRQIAIRTVAHYERATTAQASRKQILQARAMLERNWPAPPEG